MDTYFPPPKGEDTPTIVRKTGQVTGVFGVTKASKTVPDRYPVTLMSRSRSHRR